MLESGSRPMIDEKFIILALLIDSIGSGNYVLNTLRGQTKPNRVTWSLWVIISAVAVIGLIDENAAKTTIILTIFFGLMPLMIFIASFYNKQAYWKITRFDWACGFLSLLGIAAWIGTGDGNLAIIFAILANSFAWVPTLVKAYKSPETESWLTYFNAIFASIITLLTVKTWTFASVGMLFYFIISCSVMSALVKLRLGPRLIAYKGRA